MKLITIEGIVISESNYSESSKILNIYTKEKGIISAISKGCRRLKSPLRSVSNKLTYGNFTLSYKENGLSTLTNVDILDNFKNIMTDILKISYSTFILDLSTQVAKQNDDKEIFNILIESLKKINEGLNPEVITLISEIKCLKYLGIDLNIDSCGICGNKEDIVTLSIDACGYICKNCISTEKIISMKSIKVLRLLYYVDINKITKLELSKKTIEELTKFMNEYYDKYSGLYLKSKDFLKKLEHSV